MLDSAENGDQISNFDSLLKVESSAPLAVPVARRGTSNSNAFLLVNGLFPEAMVGEDEEEGEFDEGDVTKDEGDQAKVAVRGKEV